MPLGVDGTVYDLDGSTKAGNEVKFSVHDQDSGFYIEGNLRDGRYSTVITGSIGDNVTVKAWTSYHNSSSYFILSGSMHGFDILLDLSLPQMPPEIVTLSLTEAYEDSLYAYDVNATDPNDDPLEYSLLKAPEDMQIDKQTGVISWIPSEEDVGTHDIAVNVSDGYFSDTQEFTLTVINVTYETVNTPPVFTSVPLTKASLWNLYYYDADAQDSDGGAIEYSLISKPNFMHINKYNGKIFWIPYKTGYFKIIIAANDSMNVSYQEYVLTVANGRGNYYVSLTEFNGTANRLSITNPNMDLLSLSYLADKQDNLILYSGKSQEYFSFGKVKDKLYKYIVIIMEEDFATQNILSKPAQGKISFRVKKTWLSKFSPGSIKLVSYNPENKKWESLNTKLKTENWEYYFYESEIQRLGKFAIVARISKEAIQEEMNNIFYKSQPEQLERPFIVTGKISLDDSNLSFDGFEYTLTNLQTGETANGKIVGNVYSEVLSGEIGDEYILTLSRGDYKKEIKSRITADLTRQDMSLDISEDQYTEILAKEKGDMLLQKIIIIIPVLFFIMIFSFYLIKRRWK